MPPTDPDRAGARQQFGIADNELCVLVFGGSLGARSINQAAIEGFRDAPFRVLHIAGRRDFADLTAPSERYVLRDYVTPFSRALAAADLAVARSGGSVFELAQYGLPAVLIPYPHASADHQTTNARWMTDAGAAVVIPDAELTPQRLAGTVGEIVGEPRAPWAHGGRRPRPGAARRRTRHRARGARRRLIQKLESRKSPDYGAACRPIARRLVPSM